MGDYTGISWCHHTFNGWWGCEKVSPECAYCYAETWARFACGDLKLWGPAHRSVRRLFGPKHWREPLKWNDRAAALGVRERVFAFSMGDVFEDNAPAVRPDGSMSTIAEEREIRLWPLIRECTALDWMLLTKREDNIARMLPSDLLGAPHIWLGVTVGTRDRKPALGVLREIPAAVRFMSGEPLLEDLGELDLRGIHLAIFGGESGGKARPCQGKWILSGVAECQRQGTAPYVKQLGSYPILTRYDLSDDTFTKLDAAGWTEHDGPPVLRDRKGADPREWALEYCVREMPHVTSESTHAKGHEAR